MNAYLFPSLAQAQNAAAGMDGAVNGTGPYPKAGVDIGGGTHAPPSQSVTVTYSGIWRNPAGTQWAFVADSATGRLLPLHFPVPGVTNALDVSTWTQVWP